MKKILVGCFVLITIIGLQSCKDKKATTTEQETIVVDQTPEFPDTPEGKAKKLIYEMEQVNGGWSKLLSKNDVEFTYEYHDYTKGKDISTERLIFNGETSFAKYNLHEVNVFPNEKGAVTQYLDNGTISATVDGKTVTDEKGLAMSQFLREVNPFWFSMMYKLSDPNVIPKFIGNETVNNIAYNKVSIAYKNTGKEADDGYILYFNPETKLVDFFYFSLPAWGINEPVLKMELKYETIDGILIAAERTGVFPNPETGEYKEGGKYTSKNIKFNNGFTKENISK